MKTSTKDVVFWLTQALSKQVVDLVEEKKPSGVKQGDLVMVNTPFKQSDGSIVAGRYYAIKDNVLQKMENNSCADMLEEHLYEQGLFKAI